MSFAQRAGRHTLELTSEYPNNFYGYSNDEMDGLLEIESGSTGISGLTKR